MSAPAVVESWNGTDVRLGEVEARSPSCAAATARPGAAAEHPHVGDDAHRVGAGGVARAGARTHSPAWPSAIRPARSSSARSPTPARTGSTRRSRSSATRCPAPSASICSEIIALELQGTRAKAPASIVEPLLISDLPVFLRWRGEPPWGSPELDQIVRRRRPAHRRLDGVGRPAVSRTDVSSSCSSARRCPTSPGRARRAGARCSRRSGPTSRTSARSACTARRRRPTCSPAGCARGSAATTSRSRSTSASGSRASTSTASRRRSRRATRRRRATCSPTSSTASPATRSTRPRCARSPR